MINSAISFKEMKRKVIAYLQANGVMLGLLNEEMLNSEIVKLAVSNLQKKGFSRNYIKKVLAQVTKIMNDVELQSLDNATLMEGVPQTLQILKEMELKLGIMTRGCHEYAQKVLDKFNLGQFFDAIVARDDVKQPKPNPEHAFHLLKLLDVKPQETLFVGDHLSDAECANKAGLNFILVDRGQCIEKGQELGVPAVNSINDIIKFIELTR